MSMSGLGRFGVRDAFDLDGFQATTAGPSHAIFKAAPIEVGVTAAACAIAAMTRSIKHIRAKSAPAKTSCRAKESNRVCKVSVHRFLIKKMSVVFCRFAMFRFASPTAADMHGWGQ